MIYLFNPEHDLALASGEAHYMPPASARQMAADLALLPAWYADVEEGVEACVLAPSAYNQAFLADADSRLDVGVRLLTPPEVADAEASAFRPWGWDAAVRRRLLDLGADVCSLPSAVCLENLRAASHRSVAVSLLPKLRLDAHFCGDSTYLQTLNACRRFVEATDACLLKAPLSGSGKGLNWCKGHFSPYIEGWCARLLATQGGVVGEPIYNKVEDFAMEFRVDGCGEVRFAGYSLFCTGRTGMYEGNRLLSDAAILRHLSTLVPIEVLGELRLRLQDELSALLAPIAYQGYLGVDMMICRFPSSLGGMPEYRIHPCVEVNLRMNMGLVARRLADRYLHPASTGLFGISYHAADGEALREHNQRQAAFPLVMEAGYVRSGYMALTPVHGRTRYRAWMLVTGPPLPLGGVRASQSESWCAMQ
ncbi:MAG: hypothetical protein LBN24_07195 [Mediterranea sp.]|nr:hypothetical protein [Mediterranea sp.]